jgi:hypothetical protein
VAPEFLAGVVEFVRKVGEVGEYGHGKTQLAK